MSAGRVNQRLFPSEEEQMDPCLLQKLNIALPSWRKYSAPPLLKGYSQITSLTPIVKEFLGEAAQGEGQLQADNLFARVHEFHGSETCIVETVTKKRKKAYCKVTHLLDPIRFMQSYYKHPVKGERRFKDKLENPMNQAFVDGLANYLCGQLRERKLSPHFCLFYGGFQATADKYRFCITDDFESFRLYKPFWDRRREGLFKLVLKDDEGDEIPESECEIGTPKSSLHSSFSYSTRSSTLSSSASEKSHITLNGEENEDESVRHQVELESISSADFDAIEEAEPMLEEVDEDEYDDEEDVDEDINIYTEFEKFPVMLIFQEHHEGVLDDLLDEDDEDDTNEEEDEDKKEESEKNEKEETKEILSTQKEAQWTAWIFQIIAALCAAQGTLGFTHNDLHSNNIVWAETTEPWLYYKNRAGDVWRVPTYGKIFRLIDFGRAVFRVGEKWFMSDDYERGGDAHEQHNCEMMRTMNPKKPLRYPNPSFDLCRLSVSILEPLFPEVPIEKLNGQVLSKEGNWEIRETESPLFNLLWSWLVDEKGRNVLKTEDGSERFPDFELYSHITAFVHSAKPQDQVDREIFSQFKMKASDVGDWETVYPLFC